MISAIIQIAQDVDAPWPIEVYDRRGNAYNVTLDPGEMLMYESHSTLHGNPYPLSGRSSACLFVHFVPVDYETDPLVEVAAKLLNHKRMPITSSFDKSISWKTRVKEVRLTIS